MIYYTRILDVCVSLVCVCTCMLSGRGLMVNLYVIILLCLYDLYVGGARYVIGKGPLCSVDGAHYMSLGGACYTQWVQLVKFSG